jgi:hypothetical protein
MNSIRNFIQSTQYQVNGALNSTLYGVPLVTCGLIGITSMVLAYVTISENNDGSTNTIIPSSEPTEPMQGVMQGVMQGGMQSRMQGGMHSRMQSRMQSKKSKRKTHKRK